MNSPITKIKQATIVDVAREAGVSIKTVSRVVNREPAVREKTRAAVQAVIDRLAYQPNISARRMGGHRTFQITLVYLRASALYFLDVQYGLLDICKEHDYGVTLCPIDLENGTALAAIKNSFRRLKSDGLVLTPPFSDMPDVRALLREENIPFACIAPPRAHDHPIAAFSRDRLAAAEMTRHLINLGHPRTALVAGHPDHSASQQREEGVLEALDEAGLTLPKQLRVQGFFDFPDGIEAGEALLSIKPRPTAIFCANDVMAAGVLHTALRRGLRIPEDLSITGFDDSDTARQTLPQLSTVRQPVYEMAREAGRLLLTRLSDPKADLGPTGFECTLVIRDSTGPCPDS